MLRALTLRLRTLWRRDRFEADLDDEIRFHLSEEADDREEAGASRISAEAAARKDFGSTALVLESTRDAWRPAILASLAQDLRFAVRTMRRTPGVTSIAILTLAIGIGAASTIVSVVNAILLQPLAYPDADRLVRIFEHAPPTIPGRPPFERGITYQEFRDWRQHARTLSDATAIISMGQRTVRTPNGVAGLWGAMVASNAFAIFQTQAALGRTLTPEDEASPDVVVLSHSVWQRHFNGDPHIVGSSIELRAGALQPATTPRLLTVVGVLPTEFPLPRNAIVDFVTPVFTRPNQRSPQVMTIGKLAEGVSLDAAITEANAIGGAMRPAWPATVPAPDGPRFEVVPLKEEAVGSLRPALGVLFAAVVVLLLIVCANVANLMLARGNARRQEMSVRLAIGASRGRLFRQVLTECLFLALVAGCLGAAVAGAGVLLVKTLAQIEVPGIFRLLFGSTVLPRADEVQVNLKMLGITFAIAALTTIAFGMLPALQLARTRQLQDADRRGGTSGRSEAWVRGALTVAQLTLATVLLVGAGLLVQSLRALGSVDKGYDGDGVVAINLLFSDQYDQLQKTTRIAGVLERLRALPGMQAVGFARHGLLIGEELYIGSFVPPGRTLEDMKGARVRVRSVSDGFLTAMNVPVLEGRELSPLDHAGVAPVVVLNREAATLFFGNSRAVGQTMEWHLGSAGHAPISVVGVVANVRQESLDEEFRPEVFIDYRQMLALMEKVGDAPGRRDEAAIGFLSFAARTSDDAAMSIPAIRRVIREVDAGIGIDAILPMDQLIASSLTRQRFYAILVGAFAAIAAFLAAIGIYGVLAYSVVQRTREIGIRMALGASRRAVLSLILRQGLALTTVGILAGLATGYATAPLLRSMLFGVAPIDPPTFAAVALLFSAIAILACVIPARRATSIDPLTALRRD